MWIVKIALNRPYTFIVMALLILLISPIVISRTPTDIFPNVNIPVIAALWNYQGLSAEEMADRITSPFERNLSLGVTDMDHIESQTVSGRGIVKVFFHPGSNINVAIAEMTAMAQSVVRQLPPAPVRLLCWFSAPPAFQFFNWGFPARVFPSSNCSTSPLTLYACRCPRSRARRFLGRTEASSAK